MIINSDDFRQLPELRSAVLSESGDDASTLELSWAGYGPEWLRYMEPVTVMHRGRVLFHGRVKAFSRGNEGGSVSTEATVTNALWLLDNTPLGAQVAEAMATEEEADFSGAANGALASWGALAESCMVAAPSWVVDGAGHELLDGMLWLDVRRANFSCGAMLERNRVITAWTALLEMRQANPDACFRFVPTSGAIEVVSVRQAFEEVWRTDEKRIFSCSGIGPQYENCVTGVALVVSWKGEEAGGEGGSIVSVYPENVEPGDSGVKIFTASARNSYEAAEQTEHVMEQLRNYYSAVNELQYSGSVSVALEDVEASPLANRLSLVGPGTHESWHSMRAMVTAVSWDFLAGTVEVQMGAAFGDLTINELKFPDPESPTPSGHRTTTTDESSSSTGSGSGPIVLPPGKTEPWNPPEWESTWDTVSRESTEEQPTGSLPSETPPSTTTPPIGPTPPSEPTTSESTTSEMPSEPTPSEPTPTAMPGSGCDCDCPERWAGFEVWKETVEERLGKVPQPCGCADKWSALDVWKITIENRLSELERRVAALEEAGGAGGTCNCDCDGLLEKIQAAISAAATGVTISASVEAPVMTTATGDLGISCVAEVTASGGSGSVRFSY